MKSEQYPIFPTNRTNRIALEHNLSHTKRV